MIENLPAIFLSNGVFQELPSDVLDSLSDAQRAVYLKVKTCAANLQAADEKAAAAIEHVKTCHDAVKDFEKFIAAIPAPVFLDLWRESKATRASGQ